MAEATNVPQSGSQPVSQTPVAGTNSDGNRSAAQPNPAPVQDRDANNRSQAAATDRRQADQQREEQARQQAQASYPQGAPQVPGYGQPPQAQPQGYSPQAGAYGQPQAVAMPQLQIDPRPLINQFGYEGAEAIYNFLNQVNQPVLQHQMATEQRLTQREVKAIESEISARGAETYGADWKEVKGPVMDLIKQHGLPLETAYAAVQYGKAQQKGADEAYQNMNRKESANAQAQGAQPSPTAQPVINSFDDAFNAAYAEHNQPQ